MFQVAKLNEQGKLKAPAVEDREILVLHDNCATPNIASHQKHFPGATLNPSSSKDSVSTATGQPFGSNGEMTVPVETLEGHKRSCSINSGGHTHPVHRFAGR